MNTLTGASTSPQLILRVVHRVPHRSGLLSSIRKRTAIAFRTAQTQWHPRRFMRNGPFVPGWHPRSFIRNGPLVPEGRRSVARGASPWTTASSNNKAPEGRQNASGALSPFWGLPARSLAFQGLTPLATNPGLLRSQNSQRPERPQHPQWGCHWRLARQYRTCRQQHWRTSRQWHPTRIPARRDQWHPMLFRHSATTRKPQY